MRRQNRKIWQWEKNVEWKTSESAALQTEGLSASSAITLDGCHDEDYSISADQYVSQRKVPSFPPFRDKTLQELKSG